MAPALNISRGMIYIAVFFSLFACNEAPSSDSKLLKTTGSDSTEIKKAPVAKSTRNAGIDRLRQKLDSLDALLKQEPNNQSALLQRAELRLSQKDFRGAKFDLQRSEQIDSNQAEHQMLWGNYYFALNQSREARGAWKKCAELDSENIACRLELGKLYTAVQDFDKAVDYFNQVIDIDAYNAEAYFLKGIVVRTGYRDTSLALSYFQKATELKQDYVEALDMMGVTLAAVGDTLAPFYYRRILEIEPQRSDVYYKLGVFYMNQEQTNKAIEAYTKATQLNPKDADSYYNLGFIFVQIQEYQDAKSYFSRSIQAESSRNYKAYYGRAYCHEMLGDVINAKKDYRKAIEILPLYKPAMEGLNRIKSRE